MRVLVLAVLIVSTALAPNAVHARRRAVAHPAPSLPLYEVLLSRWTASSGGFASWQFAGTRLNAAGELELDPATAVSGTDPYGAGGYYGRNFYNGASFMVGEATGPVVNPRFGVDGLFPSWNAATPPGTWIETQARFSVSGVWRGWYNWGVWDDDNSEVLRHSWKAPPPANLTLETGDVTGQVVADGVQLRMRLFSTTGVRSPTVRNAALTMSGVPVLPPVLVAGDPSKWNRLLDVPRCSQMVYPDGGTVWCSPTSTSMVLAYLMGDTGPCEPRVRAATAGTHDWILPGYGFWSFNTAYAATYGFEAYATRLASMREVEKWIAVGIPVVISFAWSTGELTGAAIPRSNGHLAVIVGFDAHGNPIVNDPAAPNDATVRRTYLRSELEALWLRHFGGSVYLIYPAGMETPLGQ